MVLLSKQLGNYWYSLQYHQTVTCNKETEDEALDQEFHNLKIIQD
jgi:hypothetical protein